MRYLLVFILLLGFVACTDKSTSIEDTSHLHDPSSIHVSLEHPEGLLFGALGHSNRISIRFIDPEWVLDEGGFGVQILDQSVATMYTGHEYRHEADTHVYTLEIFAVGNGMTTIYMEMSSPNLSEIIEREFTVTVEQKADSITTNQTEVRFSHINETKSLSARFSMTVEQRLRIVSLPGQVQMIRLSPYLTMARLPLSEMETRPLQQV